MPPLENDGAPTWCPARSPIKGKTELHRQLSQTADARELRIIAAAVEVFSELSFDAATTDEIARRARVSKRDIYSSFPTKDEILIAVIRMVLQTEDETFATVVADSASSDSLQDRLEIIGLALVAEILSPGTGFILRLISSESIREPEIGAVYFENWHKKRRERISAVFANQRGSVARASSDNQSVDAAAHYLALIAHLPQLSTASGIRRMWTSQSVQVHVRSAVECFLRAYPTSRRRRLSKAEQPGR